MNTFLQEGTDIMDQRCDVNTTTSKTRKWTKKIFFFTLDNVRVNSQTVFFLNQGKDPRKQDTWKLGWDLAMALIMPHMRKRRVSSGLSEKMIATIDSVIVPPEEQILG